ncbi:MAG: DUF2478 domain-containing protein [Hyphomicrobium sp.]
MRLAAIRYEPGQGDDVDALLRAIADTLRNDGHRLAGAVQWNEPRADGDRCGIAYEDLATGQRIAASEPRKGGVDQCRLDSSALEDVAGLVAAGITEGVALVIINRFGRQEAAGQGFRAAIEAAVANDLPVLTSLNTSQAPAFDAFAGGHAVYLDAAVDHVAAWCRSVLSAPPVARHDTPAAVSDDRPASGR